MLGRRGAALQPSHAEDAQMFEAARGQRTELCANEAGRALDIARPAGEQGAPECWPMERRADGSVGSDGSY